MTSAVEHALSTCYHVTYCITLQHIHISPPASPSHTLPVPPVASITYSSTATQVTPSTFSMPTQTISPPPWTPPFSVAEITPIIHRHLLQNATASPEAILDLVFAELLLPPSDLSSRNLLASVIYTSCYMIRSMTAHLAHSSAIGLQLDPSGYTSLQLIANTLSILASRPLDPTFPVTNFPTLPPPPPDSPDHL